MRMLRSWLVGTLLSLAMGLSAQAEMIEGSLSLAGFDVSQNGPDLLNSTIIDAPLGVVTRKGDGDFSPILAFTQFTPGTIDLGQVGIGGFGYSLSNAAYGTFVPNWGEIKQQLPNFLDLFMRGVFTPSPSGSLSTFSPAPVELRISINQSGAVLSEAITLNTVPEPSSLALLGIGSTVGLIGVARRRWKKA